MGPSRTAMLVMLAATRAGAQALPPTLPPAPAPAINSKPIFMPPPLQWDAAMLSYRPALQQTATDFARLTGGVVFGMSPGQVNASLPDPYPAVSWTTLSLANEFPGEIRFFAVSIGHAGAMRMDLDACVGRTSSVVFLFSSQGLFRLSYRLVADKACDDTNPAAQEIFARYVPIGPNVARSVRYRSGKTELVDITDALAGTLTPIRWRQGGS